MAKQRNISRLFAPVHQTAYTNLLVSGCSYTWNNSEQHLCTWPYYLRDLAQFNTVLDCSQSGSGFNHAFNSIINEIETNPAVMPATTLVIIMWSGVERVDITADNNLVRSWSNMETQAFGNNLTSLSLFNQAPQWTTLTGAKPESTVESLRKHYRMLINSPAQVFDSYIKLIALHNYLENLNFKSVFLEWESIVDRLQLTESVLNDRYRQLMAPISTLGAYATKSNQRIPGDGHPSPAAHLDWTQQVLLPYLIENNLI